MLTTIDLFAGCGGLTRGLEWAGYECLAFNELNKDAADSFASNFPESLRLDGSIDTAVSDKVIKNTLKPLIKAGGGLDLLCGGPPCQGYSGIGHRRTHSVDKVKIPTNHLFKEMIRAINKMKPNVFLFENVEGILSGTWIDYKESNKFVKDLKINSKKLKIKNLKTFANNFDLPIKGKTKAKIIEEIIELYPIMKQGKKGEIFRDVWDAFSSIRGYTAQPTLIHAYSAGVPQNRPRVMIMGVKNSILKKKNLKPTIFQPTILEKGESYSSMLRNNGGFFRKWDDDDIIAPNMIDVLSDLDFYGWTKEKPFYKKEPESEFQKLMRKDNVIDKNGREILTDHEFSKHSEEIKTRAAYMIKHKVRKKSDLPKEMQTKKFSQKPIDAVWEKQPNITACSTPDDYFHYAQPRSYSVREWARIQTFPDKHIFCGKRTTGGPRRAGNPSENNWDREVPKYTQIGNAVPPLLGQAIGERIKEIIKL
jgi:DNA (cytosine-5)-methyltransferase 1